MNKSTALSFFSVAYCVAVGAIAFSSVRSLSAAERNPVPPVGELEMAEVEIRKIFAEDAKAATTPDQKLALAKRIREVAKEEGALASKFALLRTASRLATLASDVKEALAIVQETALVFDVDVLSLRADLVADTAKLDARIRDYDEFMQLCLELNTTAIASERFEISKKLIDDGILIARKHRDISMVKYFQSKSKELATLQSLYERMKVNVETLQKSPDDAAANRIVGQYLCFARGEWIPGLQFLAKGDDDNFARLAKLELCLTPTTDEKMQIADGWWNAAQRIAEPMKQTLLDHARELYFELAPVVTGLAKVRIEKRLAELRSTELPVVDYSKLPPSLKDDLVLWYSFDSQKTLTQDQSKSGNHLRPSAQAIWEKDGVRGGALHVAGNQHASTKKLGISGNQARTISFWVRPTNEDVNVVGIGDAIDLQNSEVGNRFYLKIWGKQWFCWGRGQRFDCLTGIAPKAGVWSHVVVAYDGADLRWFLDGEDTKVNFRVSYNTGDSNLFIGGRNSMEIDEIMVWKRSLSPDDVSLLHRLFSKKE